MATCLSRRGSRTETRLPGAASGRPARGLPWAAVHPRPWRAHLPAGSDLQVEDLTARHSLPRAWAQTWARDPRAALRRASALRRRHRRPRSPPAVVPCRRARRDDQGRRPRGWRVSGLGPGDRVLWSTASSLPAVVVNIAALRAGLVVVPVNPAYTERELAHVVGDVRPAAAVVDDRDRAAVVSRAAGRRHRRGHARPRRRRGRRRRTARRAVARRRGRRRARRGRARRHRAHRLHVGDHGRPQGSRAHPRQPARQQRVDRADVAVGRRRTASSTPCPSSTATACAWRCTRRCWPARRWCCCRASTSTPCSTPAPCTRRRCSSASPPCTTDWRRRAGWGSWRACAWRCRARPR